MTFFTISPITTQSLAGEGVGEGVNGAREGTNRIMERLIGSRNGIMTLLKGDNNS